ncbi:GntR family transcriptional regulator [Roseicitreum antarcticum]|uniref:Regulatory protein, gntR family n=1 Tax=Roseicitreum antarcticum TaxID=564137 RepID=A0A1H3D6P9_9RHOB|nr:GntR family transcriptional regulator [Roseicitreum antarcticum]SDX61990.1 regulatory protein, gntR family [Roseicitreum antarcticum]
MSLEYLAQHGAPLSRLDDIAQKLRLRICLMDPGQPHILYENRLAEEFGVSRTPVRQVLQRLAYERQVETRTGVGTVVPRLEGATAAQDFHLLAGLFDLAADTAAGALDRPARALLAELSVLIEDIAVADGQDTDRRDSVAGTDAARGAKDPVGHTAMDAGAHTAGDETSGVRALFALHSWLITFAQHLLPEPILADCAAAIHWRVLRRLLQQEGPQHTVQRIILDRLCTGLMSQNDARAALQRIARAVTDLARLGAFQT